jgi:hypothetical protein
LSAVAKEGAIEKKAGERNGGLHSENLLSRVASKLQRRSHVYMEDRG